MKSKIFLAASTAVLSLCQPAFAGDLDAVMARLERLEAENKKMASENADLKDRLSRIEVARHNTGEKSPPSRLQKLPPVTPAKIAPTDPTTFTQSIKKDSENSWAGAYGGLNVGYGWGTSNQANTQTTALSDNLYFIPNWEVRPGQNVAVANPPVGSAALSTSGLSNLSQRGIVGGLQAGYNIILKPQTILGFETDIQGTSIQGNGSYYGVAPQAFNANVSASGTYGAFNYNSVLNYLGNNSITSNVDWLGTTRTRLGWLAKPTLLLYATAGASYGNVSATSSVSTIATGNYYVPSNPSYGGLAISSNNGNGQYSALRLGWTAGGGIEWMFMPKWSLKTEGLYYDLGSISMRSSPFGIVGTNLNQATTTIRYDGVLARVGINYHFNYDPGVVTAKY
jgi:outer membrane immunogenic protein